MALLQWSLRVNRCRVGLLLLLFVTTVWVIWHSRHADNSGTGNDMEQFLRDLNDLDDAAKANNNNKVTWSREDQANYVNDNSLDVMPPLGKQEQPPREQISAAEVLAITELPAIGQDQQDDTKRVTIDILAFLDKPIQTDSDSLMIESSAGHQTTTSTEDLRNLPQLEESQLETPGQVQMEMLESAVVPYILHQSAPTEALPEAYRPLVTSCLDLNPEWQYYLWRDQDKREFLRVHYPLHVDWFYSTQQQQQDQLFRYYVLQSFGGLFLDLDMECVKPLTPLLSNESLFVAAERPELARIVRGVDRSADATAVAGIPGHELFSSILETLTDLPKDPVDISALLTRSVASLSEAYQLRDCRYFGSTLDQAIQWQMECQEVLGALTQGLPYEQGHPWYYKQLGCMQLRDKAWSLAAEDDIISSSSSSSSSVTVAIHRHLHSLVDAATGDSSRQETETIFNLTDAVGSSRVVYYSGQVA